MADYIFNLPIGTTGNDFYANVFKQFQFFNGTVTNDEEYKEDPVFFFSQGASGMYGLYARCKATEVITAGDSEYDNRLAISVEHIQSVNYIRVYNGITTSYDSGATFSGVEGGGSGPDFEPTNPFTNASQLPVGGYGSWASYQYDNIFEWILCTNIPIFETDTEAFNYINGDSNLHRAINYGWPQVQESEDFLVNNIWTTGTWTNSGLSNQGTINYRLLKGKMLEGSKMSFYVIPGITDGALKYGISVSGTLTALQYSEDGVNWTDSATMPYTFFYREHGDERGTFAFGVTFYSQIPIFTDKETADKFVEDDPSVSIEDAINWPQISNEYPRPNQTGDELPASQFGEVKLKGFFSQQYICDETCLTAIATDLFDTSVGGMWELMKKGLDMYPNYIEAVMGLSFWPFDVTTLIGSGNYAPASYVWFGGYGWDTLGHGTCNRIIYASGYKDIGTVRIVPTFNNWRDYEPYTKLFVSIPYCGTYQLDLARYLGKDVRVRYYVDTRTNGCICCLIADGYLMDYFNGQMGVTMPITLTDYSSYMNAQMQVLLQGGGQAVSSFNDSLGAAQSTLNMGVGAALLSGGATAGIGAALTGAKTVYGLTMNNINNFNKTKGGSSSMINCFLPQTVDFFWEIQDDIYYDPVTHKSTISQDFYQIFGSPSMKRATISTFTGYLKCQAVKLECGVATDRERERIKQMLLDGVYI